MDAVRALDGVEQVTVEDHHLSCDVRGGFGPLLQVLGQSQVLNLVTHEPTLEEVFLAYFRDEPEKTPVAPGAAA